MGKVQDEIVKNVKMGQTWVPFRGDSWATAGPIDMRQTRVGRELIKLANAESMKYWRASRALLQALSLKKIAFLGHFLRLALVLGDYWTRRKKADAVFQRNVPAFKCM